MLLVDDRHLVTLCNFFGISNVENIYNIDSLCRLFVITVAFTSLLKYVINDSKCVKRPVLIHIFVVVVCSCLSPLRNLIRIQFSDSSHHFHKCTHTHTHTHTSSYSMGLKNCHNCHKLSSDLALIQGCLLGERWRDSDSWIDFYTQTRSQSDPKNNPGSWSWSKSALMPIPNTRLHHARLNVAQVD